MQPSEIVAFLSTSNSSLNLLWTPKPWQEGHAPNGELNEKTLGLISGIKAPCSGQANSSDQTIVCPTSVSIDFEPSLNSNLASGALILSMATVPPPIRKADSTASVSLCLRSLVQRSLSILTSMSWRKFLSRLCSSSKDAILPLIRPSVQPCSTKWRNKSACVPFRFLIAGLQTAIACPSICQIMSSTISWTVLLATSTPHVGPVSYTHLTLPTICSV